MPCAYATLVTNEDYLLGSLALARSINKVDPDNPLWVMTTRSDLDFCPLENEGCHILHVAPVPCSDEFLERHSRSSQHKVAPFTKGNKPEFHNPIDNFCKLRIWELEQFDRVVYLDADVIVLRDIQKLFSYPEFSAAPNLYETLADMHRLNSGVFVAHPSKATFEDLLSKLDVPGVFWRRTDQTFLESVFVDWHGLPYIYNVLQYVYFNLPELWNWTSIRVLHYQYEKPWEENHPKQVQLKPLIDLWHTVLEGGDLPEQLDVFD